MISQNLSIALTPETAVEAKEAAAQAAQEASQTPRWGNSARVVGGVTRTTSSNGTTTTSSAPGVQRGSSADLREGNSSSIVGSARSAAGNPISASAVRPDSIVTVQGMETRADVAERMGLIRRTANGYEDANVAPANVPRQQQPAQQQQQEQKPAAEKVADLDPQAHALVNETVVKTGASALATAMTEVITSGALSDGAINAIAQQRGVAPEQVRADAARIRTAFENQARALVGEGADMILPWAYAHQPKLYEQAVRAHIEREDVRAYDRLKEAFWLARTPEEILNSPNAKAIGARREANGTITVQTPRTGTRMLWQAAVRAGLVGNIKK